MNAGKSTLLLQCAHNYRERGMRVLLYTPAIDTRAGVGVIGSRIGLSAAATPLTGKDDILELVRAALREGPVACVLVDEAQFLSPVQVDQLTDVADRFDIPIMAYGLRSDFQGNLFPGSARLFALSDRVCEVKSLCFCGRKAIMNLRTCNGIPVREGAQIEIGGNDRYVPLCRRHFKEALNTGRVQVPIQRIPTSGESED